MSSTTTLAPPALFLIEDLDTGEARVAAHPFVTLGTLSWRDVSIKPVAVEMEIGCDRDHPAPSYVIASAQSVDLLCRDCVTADLGVEW